MPNMLYSRTYQLKQKWKNEEFTYPEKYPA